MKKHLFPRLLSLILVAALVVGFAVPIQAASNGVSWKESDRQVSLDGSDRLAGTHAEASPYKPTDVVRASIVLEDKPTVQAGFSTLNIAANAEAMAYSARLQARQETMAQAISAQVLGGKALDVVWNLTLVGNVISANVPYGKLEAIEAMDGVRAVVLERTYEPCMVTKEETATPQMFTSSGMIGSGVVWSNGYTGAGSRVAVIDTGTDTRHQSFHNGAFLYALEENAKAAGMTTDAYMESLDLLDEAEIASVLTRLNAYERNASLTAEALFVSDKLAYGYNYKDNSLYITHVQDMQSEHGSHVAGISAANRYIPQGDGYVDALENVFVAGVAPDAQIITMKVFGISGGTSDADYMAAIEDAILLGCDSVNLSLGTSNAGEPTYDYFGELLDYMTKTDTVVVASAGNAGRWADASVLGYAYNDDVVFDTHGAPGSFANLLSVASVENAGSVGYGFTVGDLAVTYTENTDYANNAPMATLDTSDDRTGTVYEYVFVDAIGQAGDYEGIDLTGKVVFCSRGTSTFADKANIAASRGAAAVVIYNNQSGTLGLNLTGYSYYAPVVSILQSEGLAIKALSTPVTTDAGLTYYTGEMTVTGKMIASAGTSDYYTMSDFSSWGVPGDLSLKPEITAPGGMIYSVYGETPVGGGSDRYEIMSGTSMAAPQVSGMVALVAQYLRETGLAEKTGISARHLAQSLLMSTAQPMMEEASGGNYYSLLNQGSGLARVDLATSAESYIQVEGQEDYKVKAELGDDPLRTGVYRFSFSINNMTDKEQTYALSADLFRQDVFEYMPESQVYLLDTWTAKLPGTATFTAGEDVALKNEVLVDCDLNGDGKTNETDADFLLEYLLGNVTGLYAEGDVSGDGEVNTYDAHVLLQLLKGNTCVTVPGNGSVEIQVELAISEDARDYLDTWTPDGTYVEAYVYANAVADAEGKLGTSHSIPVLAFYGNWTDSNMFDRGTWVEMANGVSDGIPYLYQVIGNGNFLTVDYGDGNEYYFGGNPILADATYLPERNAFNNTTDDVLVGQYFTLIRNAADTRLMVVNTETGDVYMDETLGDAGAAFYNVNAGAWQYTQQAVNLDWTGTDAEGNPLPEGTTVEFRLMAAPAYYSALVTGGDGEPQRVTDWDSVGKGAYLTTQITIDNLEPKVTDIYMSLLESGTLSVTAYDNQYVAAVALLNAQGTKILTAATPNQTERGAEVTVDLDIAGISGKSFLVAVYDYANNVTTYEIELGGQDVERPYFTVIDYTSSTYYGIDSDGTSVALATGERGMMQAAEYVDGYVFEVANGDMLYVANDNDLTNFRFINQLDPNREYGITNFLDLAYNYADGQLYGLFYAELNGEWCPYLCTIDMFSGVMNVVAELPTDVNNMAISTDGQFYSVAYGVPSLYTYTVESVTADAPYMTYVGEVGYYFTTSFNSLAWDHNTNKLYWAYPNTLLEINPETAEPTLLSYYSYLMTGLFIRPGSGSSRFDPTDEVTGVTLDYSGLRTLVNNNVLLTAQVWPWNVSDHTVNWSSSNESVATVDENGMVTGHTEGTAVITATSALDETKSASCTVSVITLNKTLDGIIWDEEGDIWWSRFQTGSLPSYTKLTADPAEENLAATAMMNGTLYATSVDTTSGDLRSSLYSVDTETFQVKEIGPSTNGYSDIAPAPHLKGGALAATYGGNFLLVDTTSGDYYAGDGEIFYMFQYNLVGIAYAGSQPYSDYGFNTTIDWYFLIDTEGYVYLMGWLEQDGSLYYLEHPATTSGIFTAVNAKSDTPYFSSLYYDGDFLYYSSFNSNKNVSTLYAIDTTGTRKAYKLGTFGEGVWPAGGLMELDADASANSALLNAEITAAPTPVEGATSVQSIATGTKAASGKLNVAAETTQAPALDLQSIGQYIPDSDLVTVEITTVDVATNGRLTLSYDPGELTLASVEGTTEGFAYTTTKGEGMVELAYATAADLAADETLAVVTFKRLDTTDEEMSVVVEHTELNRFPCAITEIITLEQAPVCPSGHLEDVKESDWFHEAVDYVIANGLMEGVDDTHFAPNANTTRAQLVTVLYRMSGTPSVEGLNNPFTDVAAGQWYTDAVVWAYHAKVVTGLDNTTFAPNVNVTREQIATILYRYAGAEAVEEDALKGFADAATVSDWAAEAMNWAVSVGLIKGLEDNTLAPTGNATRAQIATILMRYCQKQG